MVVPRLRIRWQWFCGGATAFDAAIRRQWGEIWRGFRFWKTRRGWAPATVFGAVRRGGGVYGRRSRPPHVRHQLRRQRPISWRHIHPHRRRSLRGVATLKARALKEVWNVAAAIPIEKGLSIGGKGNNNNSSSNSSGSYYEELVPEDNFLAACNQEMLARGTELLKRTRKGDLHWKVVSVYIHRSGNVMLKMKSKHVASTITQKKKIYKALQN
ncbi:hypothetical protein CASFOL_018135 [Castilleja foliolosa]|uniref:Uncharacterized protein n=1 Tax=Castilleja foliolosa TaxID=1961234 RepID=A0ABD3D7K9_9LAMI